LQRHQAEGAFNLFISRSDLLPKNGIACHLPGYKMFRMGGVLVLSNFQLFFAIRNAYLGSKLANVQISKCANAKIDFSFLSFKSITN
jgi:hypothetical protein